MLGLQKDKGEVPACPQGTHNLAGKEDANSEGENNTLSQPPPQLALKGTRGPSYLML